MKYTFGTKISKKITSVRIVESKSKPILVTSKDGDELHISIEKRKDMTRRKFVLLARKIINVAKDYRLNKIGIVFEDFQFSRVSKDDQEIAELLAQNFEMANYEYTSGRTKPDGGWPSISEIVVDGKINTRINTGIKVGQTIGEYVNITRDLSNTPGGDITPKTLASSAKKLANGTSIKVSTLGKKELTKLKMGAILGVAKGSLEEPQFIIMEYLAGAKNEDPIVLVGKGVTFDTGGLSLKPSDSMLGMHMDMSGGAAVIGAIVLAAKLRVKKNIIALIPAVENSPSGESYRPGDILKSMSGKTIEVQNTDAEGRVILADALTYSKKYKPRLVVDVATLTGAALSALGQRCSAIMTKNKKLQDLFMKLGEESGDYMWPLPLWEEYEEEVKGTRGDVTNTHHKGARYGGSINGGIFLHEFARDLPWVHIDMAPRMETISSDNLSAGAAGEPVRFLLKLIKTF